MTDELECLTWECVAGYWKCSRNQTQCIKLEQVSIHDRLTGVFNMGVCGRILEVL